MSELVVTNWFGDLVSHPKVIVEARSVEEIRQILTQPDRFPSPVRAVGSNHSTARCGVADGGTLIRMRSMNRILHIGHDTVTAEAGAIYVDIAQELRARNLQFHVCTEIGNLSVGSAACAGTKDSSMPGEYGQVGSYVTGVKMALPDGRLLEVTDESDPALMEKIRCSYGTFGVVYEATFNVRPLTPLAVFHRTFTLQEFVQALPELRAAGQSLFYYIFPFANKITVEHRKYNPGAAGPPNRRAWIVRNRGWAVIGPLLAHAVETYLPGRSLRYHVINGLGAFWRFNLVHRVRSAHTIPMDQTIRYPPLGGRSRYTFSLFAFPVEDYAGIITEFFEFCRAYYRRTAYRSDLSYVGYFIRQDRRALLSYSHSGDVMTLDPVSTANPGWKDFLRHYNQFCAERNGVPLLNQTFGVTREIAQKAYGDRLEVMARTRQMFDPGGRLLNEYFRDLFTVQEVTVAAR
ncbi:MAG TPA: FAD-dependent oxidoreductase [Vicinamibacterales bacterium]|jgi:FAD/FMN-containing dehydrogenase